MLDPKPIIEEQQITYEQFVAYAEAREGRFEYVDGRVVAMGTPGNANADLAFEFAKRFDAHVRREGCRVRLGARL